MGVGTLIKKSKSPYKSNSTTTEVRFFSAKECEEIYTKYNPKNRNFKMPNAQRIMADMRSGTFKLNGESIKFDAKGNLIDGQHRVYSGWKTGMGLHTAVMYGLGHDVIDTIDSGVKRSISDVLQLKGYDNAGKVGAVANICMKYELGELSTKKSTYSHSEVVDWLDDNPQVVKNYKTVASLSPQSGCGVSPSHLTALLTLAEKRGYYDEALDFITQYSTGIGIEKDTGVHRFVNFVRVNNKPHSRPHATIYLAAMVRCFNNYVKGKKLSRGDTVNKLSDLIVDKGFPKIASKP